MQAGAALVPYRDALGFALSRTLLVSPRLVSPSEALGKPLARAIVADLPVPAYPLAGRRGIAVASRDLVGASPYSPALLAARPVLVMPGDALPAPADAVIEEGAAEAAHGMYEVGQGAYPGEGAVLAGSDCPQRAEIASAGATVTAAVQLALSLSGTMSVFIRHPVVGVGGSDETAPALTGWLRASLHDAGCRPTATMGEADLWVVVSRDTSARDAPAATESIAGLALNPGRDTRINWDGERLTFVLPARFDTVAAVYYGLILPVIAKMTARRLRSVSRPLADRLVSQVGFSDVVLLRGRATGYSPLATGQSSLHALIEADAVGFVEAESEGAPAGTTFAAIPLKDPFEPS